MYTLNLGRTVSKDLYVIFTSGSSAGTVNKKVVDPAPSKCEIIPIAAVPMESDNIPLCQLFNALIGSKNPVSCKMQKIKWRR